MPHGSARGCPSLADLGARRPPRGVSYGWLVLTGVPNIADWPSGGLEPVTCCPACGAESRELAYAELTDRSYLAAPGRWQLFRCTSCRSAYLDPRPTSDTVHLAYATYYEGAFVDTPSTTRKLGGARRAIRNGYLNSRYGYCATPATRLGSPFVRLLPKYREQAEEYVRHLSLPPGRPRLLDVGCGDGQFLVRMQALGWEAAGLDPSQSAVNLARARGAAAWHGTLHEPPLPAESYHAATFRLVIEHLQDPAAGLTAVREALKPDGVLWIAAPNLDSEAHRRYGADWIFLETPRHAVLFTASSLEALVARLGFEVVALRPSRQAHWSFQMSEAIARGVPPFREAPPLSRRLAMRARLADTRALRHPELADVVVLVARKS